MPAIPVPPAPPRLSDELQPIMKEQLAAIATHVGSLMGRILTRSLSPTQVHGDYRGLARSTWIQAGYSMVPQRNWSLHCPSRAENPLAFTLELPSTEHVRLGRHCYALAGFAYLPPWSVNAGFVCGEQLTLIVDTGPTAYAAATILGYAQAARPANTVMAVNTELHLDHLAGNSLLREQGIDVYGHPSIARSDADLLADVADYETSVIDPGRREEARLPFLGTHIANPNKFVDRDQALDLEGVTAQLLLDPGHTTANLAVWIAADRELYSGDTVVSDYRPNLTTGTQGEEIATEIARIRASLLRALI